MREDQIVKDHSKEVEADAPAGEDAKNSSLDTATESKGPVNPVSPVKVMISEDKMKAEIDLVLDPGSEPLTMEDILDVLEKEGVVYGIRKEEVAEALARAVEEKKAGLRTVAAMGEPPKEGLPAWIDFKFSPGVITLQRTLAMSGRIETDPPVDPKPFFSGGDLLAKLQPAKPPSNGRTVTNEVLYPPRTKIENERLLGGGGVRIEGKYSSCIVARGLMGYPCFDKGLISLHDIVELSEDGLAATLVVFPSLREKISDPKEIEEYLRSKEVTYGIDRDAIRKALETEPTEGEPARIVIASGRKPTKGRNAKIKYHFSTEKVPGKVEGDSKRIDFKERYSLQNVREGDLLAEKTPCTCGESGIDIFGNKIPGLHGDEMRIRTSGFVKVSEDGLRYTATNNGAIVLGSYGDFGVYKEFIIPSDVGYSTGNLDMDGILTIKGWIRTGFKVKTTADVNVEEGIEGAEVTAGANVRVAGGILGQETGKVVAENNLQAKFIEGACIRVSGNLSTESIIQSDIRVKGHIDVTGGRGSIIGGCVQAVKGVRVNELGSRGASKTVVTVGLRGHALKYISKFQQVWKVLKVYKDRLKRFTDKYEELISGPSGLSGHPELAEKWLKIKGDIANLESQLARFRNRNAFNPEEGSYDNLAIHVNKITYAGTIINVRGYLMHVKENIAKAGCFKIDKEEMRVKFFS